MNLIIYWLNLSVALTAVMWIPYILNMVKVQGLGAMGYREDLPAMSAWAKRAKKAHYNAVENLVILVPAVFGYLLLGGADDAAIACWLQIYFFSRFAHFLVYTCKVAYLRTLSFTVGWVATAAIIWKVGVLACNH